MTILIIEDEKKLVDILKKALGRERYAVDVAYDGEEGFSKALKNNYNLILLDIMLPKKDGIAVCRELRASGIQTPIIMVTARGTLEDRVRGLDIGADDYLVKPFGIEELNARIRVVLRRQKATELPVLKAADLILDKNRHEITRDGRLLALTPKEYRLIDILIRNKGRAVNRRQLLDEVWGPDFNETSHELNVHMRYLRQKIDNKRSSPLIKTIRGMGYILQE